MSDSPVRLSVLDRLVGEEILADELSVPTHRRSDAVALYHAAVGRNVEWLLNTRRVIDPAPDAFPEVQRSVFHFGLPDFVTPGADSQANRRRLAQSVATAIEVFEPRLADVRVSLRESPTGAHGVRFVIEGTLRVDLGEERIELETVFEPASGRFAVAGGRHA